MALGPGGVLIVWDLVFEAAVEDADEPVAEGSEGLVVGVSGVAPVVVEGFASTKPLSASIVIGASYLAGAIPFSGMLARVLVGVDPRHYGTGTVSGTGLYRVAGLGPLVADGIAGYFLPM